MILKTTYPILMRFPERKEDQFYYVIDVNNNSYNAILFTIYYIVNHIT